MIKTYTYKIKSYRGFDEKFTRWSGACRFVYNCALELKIDMYRRFGKNISYYEISHQLPEVKEANPWLKEINAEAFQIMLERLENAYNSFFKRGHGFPKFKSKRKWKQSIPFKLPRFQNNEFYLTNWGKVSIFKNRFPKGKLKTAQIIKKANGYYLHVQSEEENIINSNENQVGLDMGIHYFCVTSDNQFYINPRTFLKHEKQLRREQLSLSRKKKYSQRWYKQVKKLGILYLKISRIRRDYLHKVSTELARKYGTIFMENLNIEGLAKNKKLSKHILDCGWGIFKVLLSYKSNVFLVDPKYTSQKCSNCGHIESANRVNQHTFKCKECDSEFNADYNASLNIMSSGRALIRQREALACA